MEKIKALIFDLQTRFGALNPRERKLVTLAGAAIAVFALFLILFSFSSSAAAHRRRIEEKKLKLREAQALADSYRDAERARQEMERQLSANSVQLISYIGEKGGAVGLDIPSMNPKGDVAIGDGKIIESSVELTLTDVPIRQLHAFLSEVEQSAGVVKVKYLRLEPRAANQTLTAWTTIGTYRLK